MNNLDDLKNKLVYIHNMMGVKKDFNGHLGRTGTKTSTKNNTIMVYFKDGIDVPSYTIGKVVQAPFSPQNLDIIERKSIK